LRTSPASAGGTTRKRRTTAGYCQVDREAGVDARRAPGAAILAPRVGLQFEGTGRRPLRT
jgi:hypothetical protein